MESNYVSISKFKETLIKRISTIIENESYASLSKYIVTLPDNSMGDEELLHWGLSSINRFYKETGMISGSSEEDKKKIFKNYVSYLKSVYGEVIFTVDEFVVFSKLLNVVFTDYNPNKVRSIDKRTYHSSIEQFDNLINELAYSIYHSENKHAYEIGKTRLSILKQTLLARQKELIMLEIKGLEDENPTI